ncbi:dCTP deaminase domain-containing protein [Sphingomonas kyeonggiensis]|uniref:dCTP deaminase n=1 Tax=Sphingomonas kyeonggiensis TaxID=1268553 RepID=A0A7W6NV63_9SPHN|nr:deoxycytidine triphosphate deaminase [Sphingomonas kyeonggiensis]MBB4096818.1 dCTP deaminase [Sphingomonas kyeonggiensis]
MFWGSKRLARELPKLIPSYDAIRLDGAAYRLSVGEEVYVSPTGQPGDLRNKAKTQLTPGMGFTVPPGQFGFILTEEEIEVPAEALALISIRASYKFAGLVNVSGFHVDPGFKGKLLFSVFNAGPNAVHLSRNEECFLIWYADLTEAGPAQTKIGYANIPSHLTGPLAAGIQSFAGLESKISETEKKLTDRVTTLEREQAVLKWGFGLAAGVLLTLGLKQCGIDRPPEPANSAIVANVSQSATNTTGAGQNSLTNAN